MNRTIAHFAAQLSVSSDLEQQAREGVSFGWRLADAAFRGWIPMGLDEAGLAAEANALRALKPISIVTTRESLRAAETPRKGEVRSAVVRAFFVLDQMVIAESYLARGDFENALINTKSAADHAAVCASRIGPKAVADALELVDHVIENV